MSELKRYDCSHYDGGAVMRDDFYRCVEVDAAIAELRNEVERMKTERAWICRKIGVPEDTQLLSGDTTIAGTLHVWDAHQHGYVAYIETGKCEDKEGEIARSASRNRQLELEVERLQRELAVAHGRIAELIGEDGTAFIDMKQADIRAVLAREEQGAPKQ